MAQASLPWIPDNLRALIDLALDLRWTWAHEGDRLWSKLKPEMWEQTRNPWLMLQSSSRDELEQLAASPAFQQELKELVAARNEYLNRPSWFKETYPEGTLSPVAFFSMEFGLGEALPMYAGGLGVLSGDYFKTASDLQVPMVGVGILYQEGYFRRMLREYVDNIYIPVTRQIRQRTSDNGKTAHDICAWQTAIERSWPDVRFGDLKVQAGENGWLFEVLVYLGDLKPEWVSVELYAEPVDGQDGVRLPMTHGDRLPGEMNAYVYRIEAPATRPSEHYTPRIIPAQPRCRRTPGGHAYPLAALVCAYFFTREREIADNIDSDSF